MHAPREDLTVTQPQSFDVDGRTLSYVDDGDGPAVVLALGADLVAVQLDVLVHILEEEGFRVVRVELGEDTGAARADDILAVMDHAGIADAWVGGHGAAGAVARVVARDHADRVNGILLLSVLDDADADAELAAGMPVLLVHGTEDETSPISVAQSLQSAASDRASLVPIPGGGHLFPATHPGEAAFAIAEYLDWD